MNSRESTIYIYIFGMYSLLHAILFLQLCAAVKRWSEKRFDSVTILNSLILPTLSKMRPKSMCHIYKWLFHSSKFLWTCAIWPRSNLFSTSFFSATSHLTKSWRYIHIKVIQCWFMINICILNVLKAKNKNQYLISTACSICISSANGPIAAQQCGESAISKCCFGPLTFLFLFQASKKNKVKFCKSSTQTQSLQTD